MKVGDLRHKVTIQYPVQVADGMGGFTETFRTSARVSAAIWPVSANTVMEQKKLEMDITHRIRIRYRSGILPHWQVVFNTRTFSIVSIINPEERNRWLDLLCVEAV